MLTKLLNNPEMIFSVRILYATFLGILIGLQRTKIKKDPAILRTHVLVCIGSTLVTVIGQLIALKSPLSDPTRMAAQVVSGIGFICMALIFKHEDNVSGLTTASSLWVVGCLGISIGFGAYILSTVTAIIVLLLLFLSKDKNLDS